MSNMVDSNPALSVRFHDYVHEQKLRGRTVWQPRMGFGDPAQMKAGLAAVAAQHGFARSGTITLDAYTRVGDFETP